MDDTTPLANAEDGLAQKIHSMVDDVDHVLKAAARSGDQKFEAMRGEIVERVQRVRVQLQELQVTARDGARDAARSTDEAVRGHPYEAIGIAAAIGVLIGFAVSRR